MVGFRTGPAGESHRDQGPAGVGTKVRPVRVEQLEPVAREERVASAGRRAPPEVELSTRAASATPLGRNPDSAALT